MTAIRILIERRGKVKLKLRTLISIHFKKTCFRSNNHNTNKSGNKTYGWYGVVLSIK